MKRTLFKSGLLALISVLILAAQPVVSTQAGKPYDERPGRVGNSLLADSTVVPPPEGTPESRERQRPLPTESLNALLATGTIVTNTTPLALAEAMGIPTVNIVSASFSGSDPLAFGVGNAPLGYHFPSSGNTFAIMSTGLAGSADAPNVETYLSYVLGGLSNAQGNDAVRFTVELIVPPSANCASFDVAYYSEEFPEFIGSQYNDTFTAELGGTNLTISGNQVIAPLNFAFDVANNPISVNTVSGVISPTNSTYDGKMALRRAQTPVTPGQIATIVWTVQDLGDSYYDSATFLDNFSFTYNPSCNPGVEPPITPQGNLQLHMVPALPTGTAVNPVVTVLNQSAGPAVYRLIVKLGRGFTEISQAVRIMTLQPATSRSESFDFGVHQPGNYYVQAELWQGGERLGLPQIQPFSVGLGYLKLRAATAQLTRLAYDELNEGKAIVVDAQAQAAANASAEVVDFAVGKALKLLPNIEGLDQAEVTILSQYRDKAVASSFRIGEAAKKYTYDLGVSHLQHELDREIFDARRNSVASSESSLLSYAESRPFIWKWLWDNELLHYKATIGNRNEVDPIGVGYDVSFQPPFIRHPATLTAMKGDFDTLSKSVLPTVDTIVLVLVTILVVVITVLALFKLAAVLVLSAPVIIAKGIAILSAVKAIGAFIISAVKFGTALSAVILLIASLVIEEVAIEVSRHVVQEHQGAMSYLQTSIDGGFGASAPSDVSVSTKVYGSVVHAQSKLGTKDASAFISTQLFRADGRLMRIQPHGFLTAGSTVDQEWHLGTGSYWMVGAARGEDKVIARRSSFQVTSPQLDVSLSINKDALILGEEVHATLTVRNLNPSQSTGALTLGISTFEGEGFQIWQTDLGPNQAAAFEHSFVPQQEGGFVLRAGVGDLSGTIARVDRAFAVGNYAAVALNLLPNLMYVPGQHVIFNVTAVNVGTQPTTTLVTLNTYDRNAGYLSVYSNTISLPLGSKSSSAFALTVLPPTAPGAYSTHLSMNGRLYRTDDFLVKADGTLFTTVQADPVSVDVGETVAITLDVQNETYAYTDATVALQLVTPDGQELNLTAQQISTGRYQATYAPHVPGTFEIKPSVSKLNYHSETGEAFFISKDASLLRASTQGQLTLNEVVSVTFNVQNEYAQPMSDATIIVSHTNGLLTGKTNASGKLELIVKAIGTDPMAVLVEKPGFATTSMQLPVATNADNTAPDLSLSIPNITNQATANYFGRTEPGASLKVQGINLPVAADGVFSTTVSLVEGGNLVIATATDAAQNGVTITKTVFLDSVPPNLDLNSPPEGSTTPTSAVQFQGVVEASAGLLINGQVVEVQSGGAFSAWILVEKIGLNTITLTAIDAAGNETKIKRTIQRLSVQHLPVMHRAE